MFKIYNIKLDSFNRAEVGARRFNEEQKFILKVIDLFLVLT